MIGDFGFMELFIVAVIAMVVVGPKDLPKVMRSVMAMIRKVREMGSEFQAGVKKMADEVELDAVTRKLNEAGNVKLDDKKSTESTSSKFSDYEEFDYDQYDYEGGSYPPPSSKKKKDEEPSEKEPSPEAPDIVEEKTTEETVVPEEPSDTEDETKSKTDG